MALPPGARLGPYEIVGPLGAGGMGEVYRARDTKLDRDVAVKVLPPHLAESPAALARFEREAKAVAALSHPNILAIFDFGAEASTGSGDGPTAFAVMELLEGATLREKLASPIAPRKAVDYAVQIARGLAAAHDKGIVHRDLKPENVFVTTDGRVKILDFGLARHTTAALSAGGDVTMPPTIDSRTTPGTVLGTVGYMAPEQARGEPGDHRSDLFAFGAVLYELVAGRRAFQRETAVETLTATLREEPAEIVASASSGISPGLVKVIEHCLEKNPVERFQSARDIAFALEALSGSATSTTAMAAVAAPPPSRRVPAIAAAVVALAAAAAAFYAGRSTAPVTPHPAYQTLTYRPLTVFRALFAPDGKTVVYSAALSGSAVELFTVSPEYPESKSFGLRDVQLLSVSSKGELAILTHARYLSQRLYQGTLARMPLGGGAPREILEDVREADWSPDGEQLAIIRSVNGSDRLEFPAGKVLFETPGYVSDLRVSPDGQRVAFFEHPAKYDDRGGVAVVEINSKKKTTLTDGYDGLEGLTWSRDGREVLFSNYKVYAVTLAGLRRDVIESAGGLTIHDVAADGRWIASRDDVTAMMWVRPPGGGNELNLSWLDSSSPKTLSRDGKQLLFTEFSYAAGDTYAVALRKTDGSPVVRLGEGAAFDLSPDGKWALAHVPAPNDRLVIYPTGPGESRTVDTAPLVRTAFARWFPDGTRLSICGNEAGRPSRCYVKDPAGPLRALTPDDTHAAYPSPDGTVLLTRGGDGSRAELCPVAGGAPRPVSGLEKDDFYVRWDLDGRSVLVSRTTLPAKVERLDLQSGARTEVRETAPQHADAGPRYALAAIADDPRVYAYMMQQRLSTLFMVSGAR